MPTVGRLFCALLFTVIAGGCTAPKPVLTPPSPTAPTAPPPAKKETPPPSPVLSPQMGQGEEDRLRRDSNARIEGAEQIVKQIDEKKLAKDQQETFSTIQSFLAKAREALATKDYPRATNLADKARILAQELLNALR